MEKIIEKEREVAKENYLALDGIDSEWIAAFVGICSHEEDNRKFTPNKYR